MHSNPHILVVDDVVDNIQVVLNILKKEKYNFSFATQGEEALSLIEQGDTVFNLILLDIMMPVLDGFEVCRQIKNNPKFQDIPIIFLTAKVDVESISQGFSLGAVDYIIKPFHPAELLARVRTHLQLFHAKKLLQEHNIALETKIKYDAKKLLTELEDSQKEIIWILSGFMESTSEETGQHILRVAEISALLAYYHVRLNEEDRSILRYASPMHDIGKITIPHDILHKPGGYTDVEFNIMKAHTSNAYHLLCRSNKKLIRAAAIIAHEHHEQWNGQGYPRQLKGTDIHIYGRVVALADVFDALIHKRCYKDAWHIDQVIDYIKDRSGSHFDPELVNIMIEHIDEIKAIVGLT